MSCISGTGAVSMLYGVVPAASGGGQAWRRKLVGGEIEKADTVSGAARACYQEGSRPDSTLGCCVLELLESVRLDPDRDRLRVEPALFARERVLAETTLLRRHLLNVDLQNTGQRELIRTLLVDGAKDRVFSRCEHNRLH
jgi:hypothetical protein